jgi:hypothetical protein
MFTFLLMRLSVMRWPRSILACSIDSLCSVVLG